MTAAPLVLTDPTSAPTYGDGPLSRWCKRSLYDPRDEVFVRLTLRMILVMSVLMAGLWRYPTWPVIAVYLTLWAWLVAPVILMLHCTMHRPFIRSPKWLGSAQSYAMMFFFGIPTGYTQHHMGMHHVEDNVGEDLSATTRYRRDSFFHFLHYFGRFFFFSLVELTAYLLRKRRTTMARRALTGELVQLSLMAGSVALWPRFGLVAFVTPYVVIRFLMMAGNWGQHAFINTSRPNNGLSNSVTCINAGYNRRAFNDGYHIGHHLKANRHWTEMPQDFLDSRELYAREDAIVFSGLDNFLVSVLLWTGQWGMLAKRFVRLDGEPRSDEQVIAMLKERVLPVREEEWLTSLQASAG
jgi:fatty acid desaturase